MNIVCIGKASYDKIFDVDDFLKESGEYDLPYINRIGGSSANVAYLLGQFAQQPHFVGKIGSDENGLLLKREFEK